VGGLGLFFVKELMDRVRYEKTVDGFNELVMEKSIH
jgi:anti-sigma regulatory factor (Ser/Thr protein kinase)